MDLVKKLGERIRIIRKEKGISQEVLGEICGLHTNHIGAIERGEKNLTLESILKVANGLDVTLDELFRYINPKSESDNLDKLIDILSQTPPSVHKLALDLVQTIVEWNRENN